MGAERWEDLLDAAQSPGPRFKLSSVGPQSPPPSGDHNFARALFRRDLFRNSVSYVILDFGVLPSPLAQTFRVANERMAQSSKKPVVHQGIYENRHTTLSP